MTVKSAKSPSVTPGIGNWNGNGGSFSGKRSAGVQLRFNGFSFYNYPTGIAVELHRGLDKFTALNHEYGGDSRFYFTLLFGF